MTRSSAYLLRSLLQNLAGRGLILGSSFIFRRSSLSHIREMIGPDIDDVIELLKTCGLYYQEVDTHDNFEKKLRIDKDFMLVVEDRKRVIGFVMASYDGWVAMVWHLGILPSFRRRGLG